ncbi:hypothetical protein ILUMI_00290 [Ignelater luminosus]|uniref:Uncharacterized protein n=1 Tax=Ignelater luminosus TaxID=2038154 RepID=A0A8K0DHJ2_IGNLU|nr:hypothetical protein ILUMI_00290 [Ignelater luminosus]
MYFVKFNGKRFKVCKKAFVSLHGISNNRVERLCALLAPHDMRGKKTSNVKPEHLRFAIDEYIKKYDVKSTHYGGVKKQYRDARLNVKAMNGGPRSTYKRSRMSDQLVSVRLRRQKRISFKIFQDREFEHNNKLPEKLVAKECINDLLSHTFNLAGDVMFGVYEILKSNRIFQVSKDEVGVWNFGFEPTLGPYD